MMGIFSAIHDAVLAITNWLWTLPILLVLIGGGIYLTVACDFVQVRYFGKAMKYVFGGMFKKSAAEESHISGWQAVTAALSATLGTGNIVGVGVAIALGGPGAIFWMWVVGFVAMALKFAEATLAVHTRIRESDGRWVGGASRYLGNIWKPMGFLYCICITYGYLTAAGTHTGSVVTATESLGVPRLLATIVVCVILSIVLFGGLKMLVRITDKLVPFMALVYMACGLVIILMNAGSILPSIAAIFKGAFAGAAPAGGFTGAALAATIKNGCARGVYSSDAGNGSSSYIHAQANVAHPVEQGCMGIFEVFFDTIIVCTFSALVILCTGVWTSGEPGSVLAINAFTLSLGSAGRVIASIGLLLFAGSTVLSFCTFLGLCLDDMFHSKMLRYVCQVIFVVLAFCGGTVGVDAMLLWSDFGNAFTVLLNTTGMCILAGTLRKLTREYFAG